MLWSLFGFHHGVRSLRGYKLIAVMADKQSEEKRALLRAYGAEVVVCPTDVEPDELLDLLKAAERAAGRKPTGVRWGPREADLDLLYYGDRVVDTPELPRNAMNKVVKPRLAALFGLYGGPAAYFAGQELGGIILTNPVAAYIALGIGWAIIMPILMWLSENLDGMPGRRRVWIAAETKQ